MWLIFSIALWPTYVSKENTDLCSASIDAQSLAPWNFRWPKYWWLTKSTLAGYVPIEWNFTVCMLLLAPSAADLIEKNPHKTARQSCLLLPFPAVMWVCLDTAMIHDCSHGTFGFLTYDLAVALIFWQVYSLKWFVLVSSQCRSKGSGGAVVLGMRAGGTSAATTSPPNSPFIIFSINSHHVWLMPSYLGRDFPSVYVETKLSAM